MLAYSTVQSKLNKFLREKGYRIPTPEGCYTHNPRAGTSFKYAKHEALSDIERFVEEECGDPDFVSVLPSAVFGGKYEDEIIYEYVVIHMRHGSNP